MYHEVDDFVMNNLGVYNKRNLKSAEAADLKLDELDTLTADAAAEAAAEEAAGGDDASGKGDSAAAGALDESECRQLTSWMEHQLAEHVLEVRTSDRLVTSPAIITGHESAALRRFNQFVDQSGGGAASELPRQTMEVNPAHDVIRQLHALRDDEPALASALARQLFDNSLIAAGLMDDTRTMLPRLNDLLSQLLHRDAEEAK
eukprot:PLAT5018.4.p1 GENE.PLAT5018.4~~PLAT5018.4.p1  ORF type:complete len:227 (-),score=84.79 PLAT5018.4:63-671(-)